MKYLTGFLIGILIAGSYFFICNPVPDYGGVTILRDTARNSNYQENPIPTGEIQGKPDEVPDTLIIYRDTLKMYADTLYLTDTVFVYDDYFIKRVYGDTLQNDSNAFVFVRDSIYMNRILNRYTDIQVFNTTTVKHITTNDLFVTLGAFYIQNPNINVFGLKTGLENYKNEFNVGIGTEKTFLFEYERKFNIKPLNLKTWLRK